MTDSERNEIDNKVDDILMACIMIEGACESIGITRHLQNQFSTGSTNCYPDTLSGAVVMLDNFNAGSVTTKARHNDNRNKSETETEDNIAGAHVADDESYDEVTDDASNNDKQDPVENSTDTEERVVDSIDSDVTAVNNTMAAIMASVGNGTMIDNPNQYTTLDDDDMSFGEASIGEIAGIMIVVNSPVMDEESDDDSMPELRIRGGDDDSSDDDSDDDSDGDDDSSDDESSDDEESNSNIDSDIESSDDS